MVRVLPLNLMDVLYRRRISVNGEDTGDDGLVVEETLAGSIASITVALLSVSFVFHFLGKPGIAQTV